MYIKINTLNLFARQSIQSLLRNFYDQKRENNISAAALLFGQHLGAILYLLRHGVSECI